MCYFLVITREKQKVIYFVVGQTSDGMINRNSICCVGKNVTSMYFFLIYMLIGDVLFSIMTYHTREAGSNLFCRGSGAWWVNLPECIFCKDFNYVV